MNDPIYIPAPVWATGVTRYRGEATPSGCRLIPEVVTPAAKQGGLPVVTRAKARELWCAVVDPDADVVAVATEWLATDRNAAPPVLTDKQAEALLDTIVDGWAQELGYVSAARCITYRGSSNPKFAAEAEAVFAARDALWTATAAAPSNPDTPPFTEANVRAFAAQFKPVIPEL